MNEGMNEPFATIGMRISMILRGVISGCKHGCSSRCSLAWLQRVTGRQRWLGQTTASPSTVQAAIWNAEARMCPHRDKTCCVRTRAVLLHFCPEHQAECRSVCSARPADFTAHAELHSVTATTSAVLAEKSTVKTTATAVGSSPGAQHLLSATGLTVSPTP